MYHERPALTLAMHHEVMVPNGKDGASYLTGAKGMALYTFKKDTSVKSACAGDCVTNWPPRQTMLNLGQSWARRFLGLSDVPRG
jgi:predicted lipoprotein with Yx(FWY)xxD motif